MRTKVTLYMLLNTCTYTKNFAVELATSTISSSSVPPKYCCLSTHVFSCHRLQLSMHGLKHPQITLHVRHAPCYLYERLQQSPQ